MKTVAAVRLQRAEVRIAQARPYAEHLRALMMRLAASAPEHPLLPRREVRRWALVLITSDKGLCGGYNVSVIRAAEGHLADMAAPVAEGGPVVGLATLGRKGRDYFARRGWELLAQVVPLGPEPQQAALVTVADGIAALFGEGTLDRVTVVHSRFLGGTRSRVEAFDLLPVAPPEGEELAADLLFEPEPSRLLEQLLPRYVRTLLYTAALEAAASEHGARVAAMTAATDNAQELIHGLTMDYNRARQAAITREIIEITATAEALA